MYWYDIQESGSMLDNLNKYLQLLCEQFSL